jgi:protocatechuate 3,4-dioxygenase, beta subunit
MKKLEITRRGMLKTSVTALGAVAGASYAGRALANVCKMTPAQTEGPFYPIEDQLDKDNDLTRVNGVGGKAKGQVVYIRGRVLDEACNPVSGALVEIWQACESGRYNHPSDPNTSVPLDESFQYWGQDITDADGRYLFKTIIPGSYPAAPGWVRPPHVHFKVAKLGFHDLTTQMYFEGQPLNDKDQILKSIPASQRPSVIVKFEKPSPEFDPASLVGTFDLAIRRP